MTDKWDDVPDIFVDGVSVAKGPFGVTVILLRSRPVPPEATMGSLSGGTIFVEERGTPVAANNAVVGRLRMTNELAARLSAGLAPIMDSPGEDHLPDPAE